MLPHRVAICPGALLLIQESLQDQILSQVDNRSLTGPRTVNMPPKILQKIPQARKEAIWVRVSFVILEGVLSRNTLRHERRG
jgi:hypothetical protein